MSAARAANLIKARIAHLELAARHLADWGYGEANPGHVDDPISVALRTTFLPVHDPDCDDLLAQLGRH